MWIPLQYINITFLYVMGLPWAIYSASLPCRTLLLIDNDLLTSNLFLYLPCVFTVDVKNGFDVIQINLHFVYCWTEYSKW